ncbi:MAG: L,D-transpeptidase [Synechococcus sp. BS307-5m-G34]|nr:L,D-transpeptidase [Synechococcus sp. BS307-5m-G34]
MTPARLLASCLLCSATAVPVCATELAALPSTDSLLVLERTSRQLSRTKDPIWDLRLIAAGEQIQRFDAVTGRYSLGPIEPLGPGDPAELGPIWIGIEPLFPTGRGHLGIHLDPSANRNANSGTLGCVGLVNRADMLQLAELIQRHQVTALVVNE